MASKQERELELLQVSIHNQVMAARNYESTHAVQRSAEAQGLVSVPLDKLKDGLGVAEAALNVAEDALIAATDRQSKLDAITEAEVQLSEAELIRKYPALEV